jgi:hypothetical protein
MAKNYQDTTKEEDSAMSRNPMEFVELEETLDPQIEARLMYVPEKVRVVITGSRDFIWNDINLKLLSDTISRIVDNNWPVMVGDCDGVDAHIIALFDSLGYKNFCVVGAYNTLRRESVSGTSIMLDMSYTERDKWMIREATCLVAFWDGQSKGTGNGILFAKALKKCVKLITSA